MQICIQGSLLPWIENLNVVVQDGLMWSVKYQNGQFKAPSSNIFTSMIAIPNLVDSPILLFADNQRYNYITPQDDYFQLLPDLDTLSI